MCEEIKPLSYVLWLKGLHEEDKLEVGCVVSRPKLVIADLYQVYCAHVRNKSD